MIQAIISDEELRTINHLLKITTTEEPFQFMVLHAEEKLKEVLTKKYDIWLADIDVIIHIKHNEYILQWEWWVSHNKVILEERYEGLEFPARLKMVLKILKYLTDNEIL
jgi:hypothetical protein